MFDRMLNIWKTKGPGAKKRRLEAASELFACYDMDDWDQFEVLARSGASPYELVRQKKERYSLDPLHYNLVYRIFRDFSKNKEKTYKAYDILLNCDDFKLDFHKLSVFVDGGISGDKTYSLLGAVLHKDALYDENTFQKVLDKADEFGKLTISKEQLEGWPYDHCSHLRKIFTEHLKDDYGIRDQNKIDDLTL